MQPQSPRIRSGPARSSLHCGKNLRYSDHHAAGTGLPAETTATTKLPVPASSLRWALVRRLVFAIPLGLLFGVLLLDGFRVN